MNNLPREVIHREFSFIELSLGRVPSENPRLVQSLVVYRAYDENFQDFRPLVVPYVQLFDPYCELTFHSQQQAFIQHLQSISFVHCPVNSPPTPLQGGNVIGNIRSHFHARCMR
jgi:hypothetical protein